MANDWHTSLPDKPRFDNHLVWATVGAALRCDLLKLVRLYTGSLHLTPDWMEFSDLEEHIGEATHLLTSVAFLSRKGLDVVDTQISNECGTLFGVLNGEIDESSERKLPFREACNKLIHADEVIPLIEREIPDAGGRGRNWLGRSVWVSGTQRSKEWTAFIDVPNFTSCARRLLLP